MLISELSPTEQAFWMDIIMQLDTEPNAEVVPCIETVSDAEEWPDIDAMLALTATRAAAGPA